jgi:opacity protein-like surface antigen
MLLTRGSTDQPASTGIAACVAIAAALLVPATADAQYVQLQGFEVTPFVGARFGGTFDVETDQHAQTQVSLKDASSYGVAAGFRFDDFSLIEFRWTRSESELRFAQAPPAGTPPSDVTLNQFHADFTREFVMPEVKGLRTFLTGSVGATHVGSANDGFTRFSFGFAGGLKQFLTSRLAIRAEASWLPIVIDPSVSAFACGTIGAGGCLVVLNGRLTQQFEVSAGPVIRF